MISEKSLNCSMISLPAITQNLPACGPMEGLALMYILKEQGALVTSNSTVSNRLDSTILEYFNLTALNRFDWKVLDWLDWTISKSDNKKPNLFQIWGDFVGPLSPWMSPSLLWADYFRVGRIWYGNVSVARTERRPLTEFSSSCRIQI
jgi:hypothetical protein